MNKSCSRWSGRKSLLAALVSLTLAGTAGAQTFYSPTGFGDLVAGFRKSGPFIENSELVVNLGNVTNFLKLAVGTTIPIANYSSVQINNMCPDGLANLQWSVFSTIQPHGFPDAAWVTPLGNFPPATLWYTIPRTDFNTQTTPPQRFSYSTQGGSRGLIIGVGNGARNISQNQGVTNQFNNSVLVTEPESTGGSFILSALIADPDDASIANFQQNLPYNIENTTPDPFVTAVRSDLYQSCSTPTGPNGVSMADPFTGQTNGPAYYVGYFTLSTDGTMTFTRDSASVVHNPPPPPVLAISTSLASGGGAGQVNSVIAFATTNGATYTLYYTNASGLKTAITNWPSVTPAIIGDGAMHSFTNSSGDASRFYSVGAH
jgi:hypothetical protein